MKQIIADLIKFRDDRNLGKHHTPEALSYALACEAGELLRLWEWGKVPDVERVKEEVADVAIYALYLGADFPDKFIDASSTVIEDVKDLFWCASDIMAGSDEQDYMEILCYDCLRIADKFNFDLKDAIIEKIIKNAIKYPIGEDHAANHGWK